MEIAGEMRLKAAGIVAATILGALFVFASADAPSLDQHYQAALHAMEREDREAAKRELRISLQENPLHAQSHFMLASLLGQEGDLDQAMVGYQRVMTLEPNNAVARYNLGTTLLWRDQPAQAARLLEDAISLRPDHVPSYNNLAKAYFLAGLPELAVASYREALRREPSNAIALQGVATLTAAADSQTEYESDRTGHPTLVTEERPESNPDGSPTQPGVIDEKLVAVADTLRAILRDLPNVTVEARGDRVVLGGWTRGPGERKLLDRILEGRAEVLDLVGEDVGDPHRLLQIDATFFIVLGLNSENLGHNFLQQVEVNASLFEGAMAAFDWMYAAAISYEVNIANATEERVAFLARPHLTTLSGTPATFIAGGDIVYEVSGLNSGDIKPYPFGTTLEVTPTLLRSRAGDGTPRVRITVKAGRRSILPLQTLDAELGEGATAFDNVEVTSEAVLNLDQTLILTGLNQREQRSSRSGVPILKSIPLLKYLFSEKVNTVSDVAIIILLTPRDPAYWDEQNRNAREAFVEKRRAYVQALQGTEEDMRRFKERYPDWDQLVPNHLASHFFLMENSEAYRAVTGMDLAEDALDFELLGKLPANH